MNKWFVYIVFTLILIPCLSFAKIHYNSIFHVRKGHVMHIDSSSGSIIDTIPKTKQQKQQEADDKKKVKEVAKAKRLPKPEKVDENGTSNSQQQTKPKRQRRPPGMERPPEIPRRNGN